MTDWTWPNNYTNKHERLNMTVISVKFNHSCSSLSYYFGQVPTFMFVGVIFLVRYTFFGHIHLVIWFGQKIVPLEFLFAKGLLLLFFFFMSSFFYGLYSSLHILHVLHVFTMRTSIIMNTTLFSHHVNPFYRRLPFNRSLGNEPKAFLITSNPGTPAGSSSLIHRSRIFTSSYRSTSSYGTRWLAIFYCIAIGLRKKEEEPSFDTTTLGSIS